MKKKTQWSAVIENVEIYLKSCFNLKNNDKNNISLLSLMLTTGDSAT